MKASNATKRYRIRTIENFRNNIFSVLSSDFWQILQVLYVGCERKKDGKEKTVKGKRDEKGGKGGKKVNVLNYGLENKIVRIIV